VIELSLILFIVFGAIACAAGLARWTSALAMGGLAQGRILNAIARTSEGFFWQAVHKGLPTAFGAALVLIAAQQLSQSWPGLSGKAAQATLGFEPGRALWEVGFVIAGLAASVLVAFIVVHSTLRVASRLLEATREGLEHGLLVLLRGSSIVALVTEATATLLVVLALILQTGEFVKLASLPAATLRAAATTLPALGLGVLLAAWVFHTAGAVFGSSAKLARRTVRNTYSEFAAPNELGDEHDSSLISNLAAAHVGALVSRALDSFLICVLGQIVTLYLCATAVIGSASLGVAPLALLALPVLVRVIGLIAAAVGILAMRVDPTQGLGSAMLRGLITTFAVSVGGIAGACSWLLGHNWLAGFLPGVLGCFAGCCLGPVLVHYTQRRTQALGHDPSAQDTSPLTKIGAALEAGTLTVVLTAFAVSGAYAMGLVSGLGGGGVFGLVMVLAGMGSVSAFMLVLSISDPIANNVSSIASLRFTELPVEAQRCASYIRRAVFAPASEAQTFFAVIGTLTILLVALCAAKPEVARDGLGNAALGIPMVLWLGVFGVFLVIGHCGLLLHSIAASARLTVGDIVKQLTQMTRDDKAFIPNYKSTVDVGLQATLAGLNASVLLALLVPTATVLAIKLLSGPDAPLLNQGVLTFPTLAAIAALTLSLIVHSLCAAHPPLESGTNAGSEQAALDDLEADAHLLTMNQTQRALRDSPMARMIETLGELGNDAVAPTAGLQAQSIAIVCLMLSPFFS